MRDHDRPARDLMEPGQVTVNVPTIFAACGSHWNV